MSARPAANAWVLGVLGALIGAYSTMCGIGGGVFAVPLLHYALGFELKTAVANSLVLVAASTTTATLFELAHPSNALSFPVVAGLVVASFVGTQAGYRAAKRMDARALKALFAVLLVAVATEILLRQRGADAPIANLAALGARDWVWVAAIGFVSGFVAPLLGIGGGLVAVPGLLFALPSLGYLGARACSMAMSTFTAWQSVVLYARDGSLKQRTSPSLAIGAAVGAAIGLQLVHFEGAVSVARGLVAFALYFAAARFAWDLWVARRTRSSRV